MNLPLFIAGRYLIARKSHNVINIISAISAVGMAVGTAALVIILSVYNGFDSIVTSMLGNIEPDLEITSEKGKAFIAEGEVYDWIYDQPAVRNMSCVITENVFIDYEGRQSIVKAKGVDFVYEAESPIRDHLRSGEFRLHKGDIPMAVAGSGLAYRLGINPRFVSGIDIYYPSRTRNFSVSNPASSLEKITVYPSGIFSINNDIDNEYLILPIEKMQELLEYENGEVSAVEIRLEDGTSEKELQHLRKEISARLGNGFKVNDRYMQNETLYRMMKYEKLSIFMILAFVIVIISFNIFGSLSMLIIEKKPDIATLRSLGAENSLIKRIFVLEGWMISLSGLAAGLVIGIGFVLVQQFSGLIKMPGNFVVQAYPVILSVPDILVTAACVAAIGYVMAILPVRLNRLFR